jgi:hypothetical protein
MANLAGRDEEKLATDMAKIRATARMRLGAVAGLFIVGLFQVRFPPVGDAGLVAAAPALLRAALPVLAFAAVLAFVVVALAARDIKRKQAEHESKQFRVPSRNKRR